jgi:hypothetical protein
MDLPAAPEKNPAPPARQSTVCGEDLIYIATWHLATFRCDASNRSVLEQ